MIWTQVHCASLVLKSADWYFNGTLTPSRSEERHLEVGIAIVAR